LPTRKPVFDFEEEHLKEEIRKRGAKRVLLQLPEGLKPEGPRLAKIVEHMGATAIVSADPCYGACDLALQEAESLGADLLIHFGHSEMMPQQRVPVIYVEAKAALSVKPSVKKALRLLESWKRVGLATTVQHVDVLGEARTMLLESGKTVAVGDTGSLKYAGQVTGCNYSNVTTIAKDVDAFLFIGGGRFHAVGIALASSKPTVIADPYEQTALRIDHEAQKIVKQRWLNGQEAQKAKTFGVLIGLKTGQKRIDDAFTLKDKMEEKRKKVTLLAIREVTPEALMQFPTIDAFVNTACPRIALDEPSKFRKPVLTVNEMLVVIGELSWEELLRKGWFQG